MSFAQEMKKVIRSPVRGPLFFGIGLCNPFVDLFAKRKILPSEIHELDEVIGPLKHTGIFDHLERTFIESLITRPRLIVEPGVRALNRHSLLKA